MVGEKLKGGVSSVLTGHDIPRNTATSTPRLFLD